MGIRVGIDLGATYSKIAFVDDSGHPTTIDNMDGSHLTPSTVLFESTDEVIVGLVAKESALIEPERTISGIKSLIGKTDFAINFDNHNWTPEEVLAFLIKKLVEDATNVLGVDIEGAVFTVPTYFGFNEWIAVKHAAEIADVNVLGVLTDASAAALAYGYEFNNDKHTVLIYDLGGMSLDVTVLNISDGKFEIVSVDGNCQLGGKDWDDAIIRYLEDEFCAETGFDGDFDVYAQQDFRLKAERAKQQLSFREEVRVTIDAAGLRARISISRTTFEKLTQNLLNESIEKTDAAIASAESKGYRVDEIILVGGSTLMPQVGHILVKKYGIEPKIYEPDLLIAKGAAIYASLYANDPPMPIYIRSDDYAILVTAKGKNVTHNISIKDWKLSKFFLRATRSVGLVDYDGGLIEFSIYEYNDVEAHSTQDCINKNEYIKLAEFALDNSDGAIPAFIQIELTLSMKGTIRICCKNVNDGQNSMKVGFEASSMLKSK